MSAASLAAVLFTDLVGSTAQRSELGEQLEMTCAGPMTGCSPTR